GTAKPTRCSVVPEPPEAPAAPPTQPVSASSRESAPVINTAPSRSRRPRSLPATPVLSVDIHGNIGIVGRAAGRGPLGETPHPLVPGPAAGTVPSEPGAAGRGIRSDPSVVPRPSCPSGRSPERAADAAQGRLNSWVPSVTARSSRPASSDPGSAV